MKRASISFCFLLTFVLACSSNEPKPPQAPQVAPPAQAPAPAPVPAPTPAPAKLYTQQWNKVDCDPSSDQGMAKFMDLLKQSKDVGCTHLLVNDSRWLRMADNAAYVDRVNKIQAAAKEMNVVLVPSVFAFGYSGRYLGFDPNLGAGLPVKDMPFIVHGKTAVPDPSLNLDLSKFTGDAQFTVPKFMEYRVSLYTKTEPGGRDREPFRVSGVHSGRWLTRTNTYIKKDGDRWLSTNTFNSLDDDTIHLRVMAQDYSDLKVELAGPLLILRRDFVPLKITSDDGSTVYREGKDFKKLVDPLISSGSGDFESDHQANNIELTDDSAIKEGQKIKASFFHAYKIYADQNTITMEDPRIYDIMEKDVANCAKVWKPQGYFMNFDEIRIGGWENPSVKPGKMLADITKRGYDDIKKSAPDATIYTWSDMYAATQNAWPFEKKKAPYYLINGNWDGSWEGIPGDVVIMNWISGDHEGQMFFANRGNKQILCGYYDARNTAAMKNNITAWKKSSTGVPNVLGFMYATWSNNFKNMKEYFALLDTYDQWGGAAPTAEPVPGVK